MLSLKIALTGFVCLLACLIIVPVVDDDTPTYVSYFVVMFIFLSFLALFGGAIAAIWVLLP